MLGRGHISHIVKMDYFFQKTVSLLLGMVKTQKDSFDDVPIYSYCINRFCCSFPSPLFFGGAVDLTRSQCSVSDTQMTIGLLGFFYDQHCVQEIQIMCHLCFIKRCFCLSTCSWVLITLSLLQKVRKLGWSF